MKVRPRCRFGAPTCRFWRRCRLARRNLHLGNSMFSRLSRFGVGCVGFLSELSFSSLHVHAHRVLLSILFFLSQKKNLHNLHYGPKLAQCLGSLRVGLGQNPTRTCTKPAFGCGRPGRSGKWSNVSRSLHPSACRRAT